MASSIPIMQPVNLMGAAVRTPYYFSKKSGKTFRWEVNAVRHLFLISCAVRVDCITIKYVNRPTFKRYSKNVIYSVAYTSVHRFLRLLFACGKAELMLSFFLFGWFQLIVSINFWFPKKVIIIWQLTSLVRVAANVFKYLLKIDYMFLLKEIYIVSDQIGNHSVRHAEAVTEFESGVFSFYAVEWCENISVDCFVHVKASPTQLELFLMWFSTLTHSHTYISPIRRQHTARRLCRTISVILFVVTCAHTPYNYMNVFGNETVTHKWMYVTTHTQPHTGTHRRKQQSSHTYEQHTTHVRCTHAPANVRKVAADKTDACALDVICRCSVEFSATAFLGHHWLSFKPTKYGQSIWKEIK